MNEGASHADAWLARAITLLERNDADNGAVQVQLREIQNRLRPLCAPVATPPLTSVETSVRTAIRFAIGAMRQRPHPPTPAETVIISKLIVIQSQLNTPRFSHLV